MPVLHCCVKEAILPIHVVMLKIVAIVTSTSHDHQQHHTDVGFLRTGNSIIHSLKSDRLRQKSCSPRSVSYVAAHKVVRRQSWDPSAIVADRGVKKPNKQTMILQDK